MAKDGTVTVKITGDSKGLKDALDDSDGHLNNFGGKMGGVAQGVGKAFAGMGVAAFGFGVLSVKAFADAEQVAAQTGAVIKSTGGVAKVTAGDVATLANSLSKMSGVDDEAIAAGENLLLTFTKVRNETGEGNDIFNQATKAALDMSVAMGTDMSSASMLMGKALNDPIKGMTALTKSGVSFTEAQKDQVKALVESGDTMGAQKIILKEMETQFGGSAKAAGETFAGQLNKLKVTAANFMEEVGSKLVPILMKVGEWLGDKIPKAIEFLRPTFELISTGVKAFVSALKDGDVTSDGFVGVMETIGDAIHRIIPIVKDVIGFIQGFFEKFKSGEGEVGESAGKLGKIVGQVKDAFTSAFDAIKAVVEVAVAIITDIWDRFGNTILEFIKGTWNAILEAFRAAFEIISGLFDLVKAIFTGKWGEAWDAIRKILDGAWDLIFGVLRNAFTNIIPTIFETGKVLLSAAFGLIWNALQTVLSDAWDIITGAISTAIDGVVGFFSGLPSRIVEAAGDLFGFVKTKMDDARQWVSDRLGDIVGYFVDLPGRFLAGASNIFDFVKTKMTDAKQWVSDRIDDIVGYFVELPGRFASGASNIFGFIKDSFLGAINWVIRKWNDLSFKIGGQEVFGHSLPSVTIDTPNIPEIHLAKGGVVTRPTFAMIGEAGPEAVIPLSRFGGVGGTTVNHYSIAVTAIDPASAQEAVITAIQEYERRNGQGWRDLMAPPEIGLPQPVDLPARLARIEERLDALEAAVAVEEETREELAQVAAKVAWAVQHGRKRPW